MNTGECYVTYQNKDIDNEVISLGGGGGSGAQLCINTVPLIAILSRTMSVEAYN